MIRCLHLAAAAAVLAMAWPGTARAEAPRPLEPATLYIVFDDKYTCDGMSFEGTETVRIRKKTYVRGQFWPGPVEFWWRLCDMHEVSIDMEVKPGENYHVYGRGPGEEYASWKHLSIEQGRALVAQRKLRADFSLEQTTVVRQHLGGTYHGPRPWTKGYSGGRYGRQVVGHLRFPDGKTFRGLLDDKQLISGQMDYPTGSTYLGDFKLSNGKIVRSGHGKLVSPDGSVFVGEFARNQPNGPGVCSAPGGAPAFCQRDLGKPVAPEPVEAAAARAVAAQEEAVIARELQPLSQRIAESDALIRAYQAQVATAPADHQRRQREYESKCACFIRGCLLIEPAGTVRSAAERERDELLQDRQRRECQAWARDGKDLPADVAIERRIAELNGLIARERATRTQAEREAAARREQVARRLAADRAERQRVAAEQVRRQRDQMVERQKKACESQLATYGFTCGCRGFVAQPREPAKGGACPA